MGSSVECVDNAAHFGGLVAGLVGGLATGRQARMKPAFKGVEIARVLAISAGCAFLAYVATTLPPAPTDVEAEFRRFVVVEQRVLTAYNSGVKRSQTGSLSNHELANHIDREVLQPWRKASTGLRLSENASPSRRELMIAFDRYIAKRTESWQLLVDGLRRNDVAQIEAHRKQFATANRLAVELRRLAEK